jgi:L-lactate dehydrogenase complex protein LldG
MDTREAFLERVRHAVREGNRAGAALPLPERGRIGYQGAGADPVERFCAELQAAGGQPYRASEPAAVWQRIDDIIRLHAAHKIVIGAGGLIEQLDLAGRLRGAGLDLVAVTDILPSSFRNSMFAADVGITNVEYLIAETGSLVMATGPTEPRSPSLLPPIHIALARPTQILPDLFDLFDLYSPVADLSKPAAPPPSCLSIITGPSKTGDIELKLVTGVHGPGEVHVIILTG